MFRYVTFFALVGLALSPALTRAAWLEDNLCRGVIQNDPHHDPNAAYIATGEVPRVGSPVLPGVLAEVGTPVDITYDDGVWVGYATTDETEEAVTAYLPTRYVRKECVAEGK